MRRKAKPQKKKRRKESLKSLRRLRWEDQDVKINKSERRYYESSR